MKRKKGRIIAFLLAGVLLAGILPESSVKAQDKSVISVDEAAAKSNFRRTVQNALDQAAEQASDTQPVTVKIPAGTYTQDAGLCIGSNTTLDLTGVKIVRSSQINCIRVGTSENKDSGVTGYAYRNIRIVGGTLDGNGREQTVVKVTHCSGFYMSGTKLTNTKNGHLMEVGGVKGLYVNKCSFSNQVLSTDDRAKTYEAVQIDILSGEHMNGTRSEVLATKNVKFTDCTFDHVPRGIGSHTAILNAPTDNVEISGCKFRDVTSCAIQSLNWVNVLIRKNTIQGAPRGIAMYYVKDNGHGTYLPSVIAKEGNTTTPVSDAYQSNDKQNIRIENNQITLSDIKDPYSSIVRGAIVAAGCYVDGTDVPHDGSGNLQKANYYISQVMIKNNKVITYGNGIRITDGKNCTVSGNKISCKKSKCSDNGGVNTKNYYGIQARDRCKNISIRANMVDHSPSNGIYVSENSSVKEITGNKVTNAGKNGIDVEKSSVQKIEKNVVSKTKTTGIFIYNTSSCKFILENTVSNIGNQGISINTKSSVVKISKNIIDKCKAYGITFGMQSKGNEISKNKISGCKSGKIGIAKDSNVTYVK